MIADRARFRHAKKLERLAGYRLPELAFPGNMLETLCSRIDYDSLDYAVREQILAFFNEFLRCDCRDSPLCGCPEKKFAKKVIELRENGLDHRQIAAYMLDEYGIEALSHGCPLVSRRDRACARSHLRCLTSPGQGRTG